MEQKLTEKQAKQVIEYFAQQAAEDMPDADYTETEKHLWKTRYQASLAIDRRIGAYWWDTLVECERNLQSFDRDPEGYANEQGHSGYAGTREYLETEVSWRIDNVLNNSGA